MLDEGLQFGASVTLTRLMNMLALLVKERPEEQTRTFKAMFEQLRWDFLLCYSASQHKLDPSQHVV